MPLREYHEEMILLRIRQCNAVAQDSFVDSVVWIIVITVYQGVSEHYLKVWGGAIEH
jgi:hypothetical protein